MIRHISYLQNGKRMIVTPGVDGKFRLTTQKRVTSYGRNSSSLPLTAAQLVLHPTVKDSDPTLTLEDGTKLRVYHASNSSIPIVYPSIVIDNFDKHHQSRRRKPSTLKDKVKKKLQSEKDAEKDTQPPRAIIPPPPSKSIISNNVKKKFVPKKKVKLTPQGIPTYTIDDDDDSTFGDFDTLFDWDFDDDDF